MAERSPATRAIDSDARCSRMISSTNCAWTIVPVVLGAGERLFDETNDKQPLRLVDSRTIGDGLVFDHLRAVGRAAAN